MVGEKKTTDSPLAEWSGALGTDAGRHSGWQRGRASFSEDLLEASPQVKQMNICLVLQIQFQLCGERLKARI